MYFELLRKKYKMSMQKLQYAGHWLPAQRSYVIYTFLTEPLDQVDTGGAKALRQLIINKNLLEQ
jgi:hypothetical protein